jgi:hypothetical protein
LPIPKEEISMESQEASDQKPFGEADSSTGAGDDSSNTTEGILRRLGLLTDQVDALQVESARGGRPWWREPSLMISAVAVVISVLFSAIGMRQVAAKDIAAKQEALRQTMVQIVEGQSEASKAAQENSGNP